MTNPSSRPVRARRRTRFVAAACATGLLLGACSSDDGSSGERGGSGSSSADQTTLLTGMADNVIVPGFQKLASDLDALQGAVDDLCTTPTTEGLTTAQDAWREAAGSWQRMRPAATGPAMDARLMSAIGFEARPQTIDKLLAGDEPLDEAGLAKTGANVRGLNAVEYGLFADGSDALAEPDGPGDRRCQYLSGVVALSATTAHQVADDWQDYRTTFISATGSSIDDSLSRTLNEVTHRIQEIDEKALRDMAAAKTYADLASGRQDGPAGYTLGERKALFGGVADLIGDAETGLAGMVADRRSGGEAAPACRRNTGLGAVSARSAPVPGHRRDAGADCADLVLLLGNAGWQAASGLESALAGLEQDTAADRFAGSGAVLLVAGTADGAGAG